MRIIVGLGNPGREYALTPHNLGFLVIDCLAERFGIRVTRPEAQSYVGLGRLPVMKSRWQNRRRT